MPSSPQPTSAGVPLDIDDINSLMQDVNLNKQSRPSRFTNGSNWGPEPQSVSRSSVPRTMGSSLGYGTRIHARPSVVSSGKSSYMQSNTGASSVFDTAVSTSSESTVADPMEELPPIYECEFRYYTECDEGHWLGEEELWFQHIAAHMQHKFPKKSWCWYCDEVFKPRKDETCRDAFRRRMGHIGSHIRHGPPMYRRPDIPLINHLHKHHLVPQFVFDAMTTFHEAPQPKDMEFCEESPYARGGKEPPQHRQRYTHREQPLEEQTVAKRGGRSEQRTRYHM